MTLLRLRRSLALLRACLRETLSLSGVLRCSYRCTLPDADKPANTIEGILRIVASEIPMATAAITAAATHEMSPTGYRR